MQNRVFENTVFYCQLVRCPIMRIINSALTSPSICLQILYSHLKFSTYNILFISARILIKQKREKAV